MIKRMFYLLLLAFVLNSCAPFIFKLVTISRPKGYYSEYTRAYTGLDSLIKIQGYYLSDTITKHFYYPGMDDSINIYFSHELLILYNDGTTCSYSISSDIEETVNSVCSNSWIKYGHLVLRKWGIYNILGDSIIKVENLNYYGETFITYNEKEYLIVSDTVLKSLSTKKEKGEIEIENRSLRFHPCSDCVGPESNPYLKKRWYWNKEAYKKMKEEKKRNKKKK